MRIVPGPANVAEAIRSRPGHDRTILRAYGLPRRMGLDEIAEVEHARGVRGLDRIQVTARSYEETLACLGLRDKQLANIKGQRFLICGEGASELGKTLQKRGAFVVAVDKLYATPKSAMAARHLILDWNDKDIARLVTPTEVFKRLPKRIVAADLAKLPFADKTFDAVLIPNVVYWYLVPEWSVSLGGKAKDHIETGNAIIDEALRVSRGYVHFNLGDAEVTKQQRDILSRRHKNVEVRVMRNANLRLERPSAPARR